MFVELKDILFSDKGGGVTQRLLGRSHNLMAGEMIFQKGSRVMPHSHEHHQQFIYIVAGKFEIQCGDEKRILGPGDCLYAAPGEIHGTLGLEDNSILLDIHNPIRYDLIEDERNKPARADDPRHK
ncbi:MAG: cupin domain-containing protein [Planctomycetes bacterium]|nr:cupin domain-containing protein [Planctomycetota bacterium]